MNVNDGKYAGPLTVEQVIVQFEYRISIHESYAGLVVDDPDRWIQFGSYEFHCWAINGYREAIRHLKGEDITMEKKRWFESRTVWVNILMAGGILAQTLTGDAWLDAEAQGAIVVVVNLVLRLITGKPLSK